MAKYKLELDIPFDELTEDGWSKVRLLRDVKSSAALSGGSNLFFEKTTGTFMLRPIQMHATDLYDPANNGLHLPLTDFARQNSLWESGNVMTPSGTHPIFRTKGTGSFTLLDGLITLAGSNVAQAQLYSGRDLIPVLISNSSYPVNQGLSVLVESLGHVGVMARDYLAIRFGSFLLSLHTEGSADLWWTPDNTTWELRKHFDSTPDGRGGSVQSIMSVVQASYTRVNIIPFGRGQILFTIFGLGKKWSGVYSHPEATYDTENSRYLITEAGHIAVYVPGADARNFGVGISKIGYKTSGTFDDILFTIPYAPTMTATKSVSWSKTTTGAPTVTGTLLNDAGAAWASNGTNTKMRMRLALAGDGTFSPYVDGYRIDIPEKIEHYAPTLLTVNESNIKSMSFEDGEEWDDQRATIQIIDRKDDVTIASLKYRSKINGRLMTKAVNASTWTPIGVYRFERPKIRYGRSRNLLTLAGKNLGVARIDRKRFTFAPSFNDAYHWAAVTKSLNLGGFPSTVITTDVDAVKLPNTERNGEATDKGETEITCQPQFNSPVREFIDWIRANFSRWPLLYKPDEKWYYQAIPAPTVAKLTFWAYRAGYTLPAGDSWYKDLESELEPPEGNKIVMIGRKDEGQLIARGAIDHYSADLSNTPLASGINYLGWAEQIYYIDLDINTTDVLETCLNKVFDAASEAIFWVTWRAPYIPGIAINDAVAVQGLEGGLVQIKSFSAEATTKKKLEKTACTTYTGKWIAI